MVAALKFPDERCCPRCKRPHFGPFQTCEACLEKRHRHDTKHGETTPRVAREIAIPPQIGKIEADPLTDEWVAYDKHGRELARHPQEPKGVLQLFAKLYGTEVAK